MREGEGGGGEAAGREGGGRDRILLDPCCKTLRGKVWLIPATPIALGSSDKTVTVRV